MSPKPCKDKPCRDCPFLRKSIPGYLGGEYTAEEFLAQHYHGEGINPCHPSVDYNQANWRDGFMAGTNGEKCRGQAEFFSNSLKRPKFETGIEDTPRNSEVFDWLHEFRAHHTVKRLGSK